MTYGNIIRTIDFQGNGWDFSLTIRAADDRAFQEANRYIRSHVIAEPSEQARQAFLASIKERTGDDH